MLNLCGPLDYSYGATFLKLQMDHEIKNIAKAEREKKVIAEETCRKYYEIMKTTQLDPIYTANSHKPKLERFSNKRKAARAEDGNPAKMSREDETSTTIMRDVSMDFQ